VEEGNREIIREVIRPFRKIGACPELGAEEFGCLKTPLHLAAELQNTEAVQVLVTNGANIQARNSSGQTPLHVAAAGGTPLAKKVIKRLKGDNIDARDEVGRTPLHLAASRGAPETVCALMDLGADAGARAERGVFAADLANDNEKVRNHPVF